MTRQRDNETTRQRDNETTAFVYHLLYPAFLETGDGRGVSLDDWHIYYRRASPFDNP